MIRVEEGPKLFWMLSFWSLSPLIFELCNFELRHRPAFLSFIFFNGMHFACEVQNHRKRERVISFPKQTVLSWTIFAKQRFVATSDLGMRLCTMLLKFVSKYSRNNFVPGQKLPEWYNQVVVWSHLAADNITSDPIKPLFSAISCILTTLITIKLITSEV